MRSKRSAPKTNHRQHTSITSFILNPPKNQEIVLIGFSEIEAFRLVDLEGLSQQETGQK